MEKSIFEKIVAGEEEGFVLWEDADYAALLTIDPYHEGHILVVPKENVGGDIFRLDDEVYAGLMRAVKVVGERLRLATSCERVIVWVRGFEVDHVHVHLIPAHPEVELVSGLRDRLKGVELRKVYENLKPFFDE